MSEEVINFEPRFPHGRFSKISIDAFLKKFALSNPREDIKTLKEGLLQFKQLKSAGELCSCGNPIWIIGSAVSEKGCFSCITGHTDCSDDYEIK